MLYGFGANEYGVLVLKKPSVEEKDSSNAYDESKSDSNNNAPFNDDLFELTPLLTLPNQKTLSSRSATTPTTPTTHSVSVDSFDKYQIRKLVANNEFAAIVLSSSEGELYASGKNVSSIYSSWSSQPYVNNNKNNHWQCNQLLEPFIRIGQGLNGQKIKNIATGNRFVVAQTVYGQLYVCGSFVGRVPLMDCEHFSPLDPYLPATLKSSAGYCHCGIISRQDGLLYVIGDNDSGELGLGHQRDRNRWTLVSFISERVKSIDFGNHNSIAIGESGNIYVAGSNLNGELGISTLDNDYVKVFTKAEITKCNRNEKAQKTACGMHHVMVLCESGHLYSTGSNDYGQLGLNDFYSRYEFSMVLPQTTFRDVSCGDHFSVLMTLDGQVLACGSTRMVPLDNPFIFTQFPRYQFL